MFLVRPPAHSPYGFGGLNRQELIEAYSKKQPIKDIHNFARLWELYAKDSIAELRECTRQLEDRYPFLQPAVQAHMDRIPEGGDPGRPIRTLMAIKDELGTKEFGPIFKEFCKREAIYGFGDLQVKRLLDQFE